MSHELRRPLLHLAVVLVAFAVVLLLSGCSSNPYQVPVEAPTSNPATDPSVPYDEVSPRKPVQTGWGKTLLAADGVTVTVSKPASRQLPAVDREAGIGPSPGTKLVGWDITFTNNSSEEIAEFWMVSLTTPEGRVLDPYTTGDPDTEWHEMGQIQPGRTGKVTVVYQLPTSVNEAIVALELDDLGPMEWAGKI